MKDSSQFERNIVTSTLLRLSSGFVMVVVIVIGISLMLLLLPFALLNFYLIKRRINHMMEIQNDGVRSSVYDQGDIIEGEYSVTENNEP